MKSSCRVVAALRAVSNGTRFTPALPARSSSFARSCTPLVMSVSAGPPLGGLYLKPPSAGGLCDGVITMPSASPLVRPRLATRMAREMTGVGVTPSSRWTTAVTPLAARTSRAVGRAGEGVRVLAEVERPVDALGRAVLADRLGDGEDVGFGESAVEGGAAVP